MVKWAIQNKQKSCGETQGKGQEMHIDVYGKTTI